MPDLIWNGSPVVTTFSGFISKDWHRWNLGQKFVPPSWISQMSSSILKVKSHLLTNFPSKKNFPCVSLEVPSAYIHPNPHLTIQEIYTVMKNSWEMKSEREREVIKLCWFNHLIARNNFFIWSMKSSGETIFKNILKRWERGKKLLIC